MSGSLPAHCEQPDLPAPPEQFIDAAMRAIPEVMSDFKTGVAILVSELLKSLKKQQHSRAAGQWAIRRLADRGLLDLRPRRTSIPAELFRPAWSQTAPVQGGVFLSRGFENLDVYATTALWAWWRNEEGEAKGSGQARALTPPPGQPEVTGGSGTLPPAVGQGEGDGESGLPPPKPQRRRRRAGKRKATPLTSAQSEAVQLVGEHKGNITAAAKAAGKSRQAMARMYKKAMRKMGKLAVQPKPRTQRLATDNRGQETDGKGDDSHRKPIHRSKE